MNTFRKWTAVLTAGAAIALVAGLSASGTPQQATRGGAYVDHPTDCMMTFVAYGDEVTSLFPAGEGLLQARLNHNTIVVGIDEERQQAFLQCHGKLPRGVQVEGFDIGSQTMVTGEFVSNRQACDVAAAIGADWCNPSGHGTVVMTQESTGAPCANYEDWRAVMAPSGQTTLRCWSNLGNK